VIRYMYNPKTDILFKISIYMSFFLAVQYIL
jgi:hypothetical protein